MGEGGSSEDHLSPLLRRLEKGDRCFGLLFKAPQILQYKNHHHHVVGEQLRSHCRRRHLSPGKTTAAFLSFVFFFVSPFRVLLVVGFCFGNTNVATAVELET